MQKEQQAQGGANPNMGNADFDPSKMGGQQQQQEKKEDGPVDADFEVVDEEEK